VDEADSRDELLAQEDGSQGRAASGDLDGRYARLEVPHDGGGPRAATVAAVPIIVKKLRAKGYDFVTLDELVALGYKVR